MRSIRDDGKKSFTPCKKPSRFVQGKDLLSMTGVASLSKQPSLLLPRMPLMHSQLQREGGGILRHAWRVLSVVGGGGGSAAAPSTGLAHSILSHWHHGNTV